MLILKENIKISYTPDDIDPSKWNTFMVRNDHGSFFHSPEAYKLYNKLGKGGFIGLINQNGDVLGICCFCVQSFGPFPFKQFFKRIIINSNILVAEGNIQLLKIILTELISISKNISIYTEIRNIIASEAPEVFQHSGFVFKPHLNIVNYLEYDEAKMYNLLTPARKRGIKKAMTNNFSFKNLKWSSKNEIITGYKLIKETYRIIKLPVPTIDVFHFINEDLSEKSRLFFALFDENDEMCVFLTGFIFEKTFYGYYVGSKNENSFLKKRPLDLFYWELMKFLSKAGYSYLNWMGAGSPDKEYGVRDFKKQYGGKLFETGRFIYINRPILYKLIFSVLKQLYSRLS